MAARHRIISSFRRPGDPGPFIRDAFDNLFDGFERLEHFIRIKLIRFEDVEPRLRYYVGKLGADDERPVAEVFLTAYGFALALRFLERFASWKQGHNTPGATRYRTESGSDRVKHLYLTDDGQDSNERCGITQDAPICSSLLVGWRDPVATAPGSVPRR